MTVRCPSKILLVDDEPILRRLIIRVLRPNIITTAESGAQALKILQRAPPFDLILCDLSMPGLSGGDVFRYAITQDPAIQKRFVIITGGATTPDQQRFLKEFHPRVLSKPFTRSELISLLPVSPEPNH